MFKKIGFSMRADTQSLRAASRTEGGGTTGGGAVLPRARDQMHRDRFRPGLHHFAPAGALFSSELFLPSSLDKAVEM